MNSGAAVRAIAAPVVVPPVNEIVLTVGWATMAAPVLAPRPWTRFKTPGGNPTSWHTSAVAALKVGDPLEPGTDLGPLVSAGHRDKVTSYIALAQSEGGTIRTGGGAPTGLPARCANGYYVAPTVITGLPMSCRTNQEEIFGPVVTVMPFRDEAHAIELANDSPYGLAASVWTNNLTQAHRVAEQVQCGTIWVNCWLLRDLRVPFGGMRQSGVGREGGDEAIRFFTEPKNVCIKL